jgi:hypothetical protein
LKTIAVAKRGPKEFPDIRKLDERQKSYGLEINTAIPQPGG